MGVENTDCNRINQYYLNDAINYIVPYEIKF